ncbi:MAG: glycosyltransferase family 2 protein [Candidatus Neomarinimicrobiota bacterium]
MFQFLLPVYNCHNLIPTLESILNQEYQNFELLICDDGSKKNFLNLEIQDKRVKIYKNEKNIGLGGTLNRLLTLSDKRSKYFSTIEQDDIYKPEFLGDCVTFLNNNANFGLVSGISEFWDGHKIAYRFPGILHQGIEYPFGKKMFLINYMEQIKVAQTCMLVRKKCAH